MNRENDSPKKYNYLNSPLYFKLLGEQLSKMGSPLAENIVKDLGLKFFRTCLWGLPELN